MRVLILGGSNSRNSGGVFNSARSLGLSLKKEFNTDVNFLMHSDEYSKEDMVYYQPLPLHNYKVTGPLNLGFSSDLYKKIVDIKPDIIHTQTIWLYLSAMTYKYYCKTDTPYIISPRGMLDPWQLAHGKAQKKIAMLLYQKKQLESASCLHALCHDEYKSMCEINLKQPIAIIPNGVSLPSYEYADAPPPAWKSSRKSLLFLSRLHKKKGLDNLLQAWALTKPETHNWQLIIAGETKDHAYISKLKKDINDLNIYDTAKFIGGQFGENKHLTYFNSDAFILPSFSEGLPMSVLEAWSFKKPVVITDYCNLPEAFQHDAAIHIDTDIDGILNGLIKLFSLSMAETDQIGRNGYQLVKDRFTWEKVAQSTLKLYKWVRGEGEKPEFIHEC